MRVYIGYLPPREFRDFYEGLVREISQIFNLDALLNKKRIPHMTLKYPFQINSINELEEIVSDFCQDRRPSTIEIKGVETFEENVIYLRVFSLRQTQETLEDLLEELRKIEDIEWKRYDHANKILHMTIAKREELGIAFEEVLDYLNKKEINFILPFDNLTIFQKNRQKTSVLRTDYFGGVNSS